VDFSTSNVQNLIERLAAGEVSEKEIEEVQAAAELAVLQKSDYIVEERVWKSTKASLLESVAHMVNIGDKESWGEVIEKIKLRLEAKDGRLLKILLYEKLLRSVIPAIIFGSIVLYFVLLVAAHPILKSIGFIQHNL